MTSVGALLLTAALALVSLIAGRVFVGALGADLLRRFGPVAAGSLVLGGAVLTLLSIGLSGVGLLVPDVVRLVPAFLLALLALAWRRGRIDALRPRGREREWFDLGLPAALTALVVNLPVLRTDAFAIGNDATTVFAVEPHALYRGHGNGFLQQTYALAVTLLGLALLTHAGQSPRLRAGNAILVAVSCVDRNVAAVLERLRALTAMHAQEVRGEPS